MLWALDLLLGGDCADLGESSLNVLCHVGRKDRTRVHGFGHRLLPRAEQALHGLAGALLHDEIGVHEGAVQVAAEVDGVGGADIFDDRVEHIERGELPFRARLAAVSQLGGIRWRRLTVRMWFSSSVDMACAYSVFSLAIRVRLLISGRLFILRS